MKHLNTYLNKTKIITEASPPPFQIDAQTASVIADFGKKAKEFFSNAFKKIKGWLKDDKTTKKETKEVIAREKDLPQELQNAVAKVMKKSGLERSNKKKKDDDIADDYDKLKALLITVAEFAAQIGTNPLFDALLEDLGIDLEEAYTNLLTAAASSLEEFGEEAKTYFMSEDGCLRILVVTNVYKYADKNEINGDRRHEIYTAQGLFQ